MSAAFMPPSFLLEASENIYLLVKKAYLTNLFIKEYLEELVRKEEIRSFTAISSQVIQDFDLPCQ